MKIFQRVLWIWKIFYKEADQYKEADESSWTSDTSGLNEDLKLRLKEMKGAQESGEGWREKVNLWLKEEEEVMGCLVKSGECVCVRREEVMDDE